LETERRAVPLPVIGNVDVERERAFRSDVAAVVDLRHRTARQAKTKGLLACGSRSALLLLNQGSSLFKSKIRLNENAAKM
jgi:hypothetical protein